jgi:hypothetical protein
MVEGQLDEKYAACSGVADAKQKEREITNSSL